MNWKRLFFIGILAPEETNKYIIEIKKYFQTNFHCSHWLKLPAHITLRPTFKWEINDVDIVDKNLNDFVKNQKKLNIICNWFGCFDPRVVFVKLNYNKELIDVQKKLKKFLIKNLWIKYENNKDYSPHITIAHRDLSENNFFRARKEFKNKEISFEFIVDKITLFMHDWEKRNVYKNYKF